MDPNETDEISHEEILAELKEELESGVFRELSTIWTELWGKNERVKRKQILATECRKKIKEFLQEILQTEESVRDDYIDRIEELLSEMNDLQESLEIVIPYEDVESLPLHFMAAHLNKKAEKYRVIKNERIRVFNELSQKEATLCEKLGMVRQSVNSTGVPKTAELKHLENHITAMEQEKLNRTVTFLEQRQCIIKLYEELGIQPLLNFEKEVVSEAAVEKFQLTNENMVKLDELKTKLEALLQEKKESVSELLEKLKLLWSYVDESEDYQKEFLSKHQGCTEEVINALNDELSRLKTKKQESIAVIVEKIRQVLVEEWDRCLVGKEEREKFRPFNINCFTEDLCNLHEFEIKRLKNFYRDNEQIFVLIGKHKKLFNKLLALESGSKNANRYYNRGGQLLQEEKERKVITKELPSVEEELRTLLKEYEEKHGEPFTSFGVPMITVLDEQWSAHFDQRTIEKLLRKKSDKTGRTPLGKRGCTTPYTPLSANKIPKLNSQKAVTSTTTPRMQVRKKLLAPGNNGNNGNSGNNGNNGNNEPITVEPTYDEFQGALQSKIEQASKANKPVTRSTAINEYAGVLRERNTPNKVNLIKTTPVKVNPPMSSSFDVQSSKTVPRIRRQSKAALLTPARNRLPIII